ncbi:hypothetical protein OJ965_09785 [Pantoea anthophila]|uniref:hypothetical protein n=1 Tax=Pantoea anthophila TaxID=470931 RepID=UPI0022363757|nr:hypothetical protein [Pantoea anthophila]UZH04879.1 hypothetical protein OJ965_09785 [Pantoea anthophila]
MTEWIKFIDALGKGEKSRAFLELNASIGEAPILSEDPIGYNDPVGYTKYFKYTLSGIEIGFRKSLVSHVHFYFYNHEGYEIFKGELLSGIGLGWDEKSVKKVLGVPSCEGGGKMDMLLGYINRWVKYEKESYALHLQFDQNHLLCRASLMIN